ncbi:Cu(I)-responsive transcriptional regulator [Pseudoalteromonas byunsanensis]|uniref:Cu(I)-responsive transcriptional regulator n=1 Tax=Pseudoalteromonas byunsanensis TaxID=327939 RepID=A0A1S1N4D4_9GAMM|nr:Cu(I)-responsive transcriptional regulator [Pseudoalteromonas byunsanensis]OHU94271.1 Cu(I)-responsive transcriptional regulator [Pseudoalteromonas byunsanensis]
MTTLITISKAANITDISAKMIRHYESIGIISKAHRTNAGYRLYNQDQLKQLSFVKQCRNLGFSISQIESLMKLWKNPNRSSLDVKTLADQHLQEIREKITELAKMEKVLSTLSENCSGDHASDCAILEGLETMASYKTPREYINNARD